MFNARAATSITLLGPGSKADTAAATGSWLNFSKYKGDVMIVVSIGTVDAGQIVPLIQTATDDQGAGAATLAADPAWTTVTTSNDPLSQTRVFNASGHLGWIRFLGTITTGPVEAHVIAHVLKAAGG